MMSPRILQLAGCLTLLAAGLGSVAGAETTATVARVRDLEDADFKTGSPQASRLPSGDKAVAFDEPFSFRIDLKAHKIEPGQFDLMKLEVQADRGASLRIAVENHPRVGDISYWYVLDSMRGRFDWKTIWVDLDRPEEIKSGDDHRSPWREGLGENSEAMRGVRIEGQVRDLKSKRQGPSRNISLGNLRFVKEAVHLNWDQTQAPYTWGKSKDLVYTYPLTLTNRLDRALSVRIAFEPVDVTAARAAVDSEVVPLAAGETKTVEARISLPANVAAREQPLYCERFLVTAQADEIADSTVTILRSSDPIHLSVTVPLDESNLDFPYFPRPSELPQSILRFDEDLARKHAAQSPHALIENALQHGLYQYGYAKDTHQVGQYRQTLVSAAILYDLTGEEKYLQTSQQLLQALPEIWDRWYQDHQEQPVRLISSGIVARWNDRSHYTLGLGWLVMGTQRSPYYYGTSGNGSGGSMSSLAYAFDIVAPQLDATAREKIINGFFLPAGIRARNHYIGDGNQQMTANLTAMYAGILARNWPLVSFSYSSEHGFLEVLEGSFDDDGVQLRKNYQTYTLRPIFWATELLHGSGFDVYQTHAKRITQIVNADPRAKGQGAPFEDMEFWQFVQEKRLK